MKTTLKTIAVFTGLLLLAGCAANADDTTTKANAPGYGPGWRHQQMMQARLKGDVPPGPMMMARGPGQRGSGPPVDENGQIDTSKFPPGCPYADTPTAATK